MEIGWIMAGFFLFVTLVFLAIAFFLPEWVGITGNKARQIMKDQESTPSSASSLSDSKSPNNQ